MTRIFKLLLVIISLFSVTLVNATIQNGIRCSTTQSYTWPLKGPNDQVFSHMVRITMESYGPNLEVEKISSAQATWKTCRQVLGNRFQQDWESLGYAQAPFPIDEFGSPRPPRICETIYKNSELFECTVVTRKNENTDNSILLLENILVY